MTDLGLDDDEWDADFLDELVKAEETALSTQSSLYQQPPPVQPPPQAPIPNPLFPPARRLPPPSEFSYSPPRELSQRIPQTFHTSVITDVHDSFAPQGTDIAKERELGALQVNIVLEYV